MKAPLKIAQRIAHGERNALQAAELLGKFFALRGAEVWDLWKTSGDLDLKYKVDFEALILGRVDFVHRFVAWRTRSDFHNFFDVDCTIHHTEMQALTQENYVRWFLYCKQETEGPILESKIIDLSVLRAALKNGYKPARVDHNKKQDGHANWFYVFEYS